MSITIGPVRIADAIGTHEPGTVIETPSDALIALADAGTCHPETGLPYAVHTPVPGVPAAPAPALVPAPTSSEPTTTEELA